MNYGDVTGTHTLYKTVHHIHLDSVMCLVLGEYPDASLNLVECADTRWFVEVDHGERFNGMQGVSCPHVTPYIPPVFHSNQESALNFALECIKKAYPAIGTRDLHTRAAEYFNGN